MRSGMLAFWCLLMLALAGLYAWRIQSRHTAGERAVAVRDEAPQTGPVRYFSLTERDGTMFTSDALAGRVWVASFFFSNCPGVCLKLNQEIAELQKELPDLDVVYVSFTVDPENDTPQRLREYAERFQADPKQWLFLTGQLPKIKDIAENNFQVSADRAVHSDRLIIIDRRGYVRGSFRGGEPAQVVALKRKLAEVVKEKA